MADKTLTELVINRGTKQKFDDLPTKSPDELYFITDSDYFATKTDLPESKTGTAGQVYTKTETGAEWKDASGSSVDIDNLTITKNASNEIQAVAVVNQNAGVLKSWTGTLAEYTALETKSDDTQYIITDDDSAGTNVYTKAEVDSLVTSAVSQANAHRVIEFQAPTAENNYTWYRKYADGWVEQGGVLSQTGGTQSVSFPVEMADANYTLIRVQNQSNSMQSYYPGWTSGTESRTTTGFTYSGIATSVWQVSGMSA